MITSTQAAILVMVAIGQAVKDAGTIPAGSLYAAVCDHLSLVDFEICIGKLREAGLIRQTGLLLKWIGPGHDDWAGKGGAA